MIKIIIYYIIKKTNLNIIFRYNDFPIIAKELKDYLIFKQL